MQAAAAASFSFDQICGQRTAQTFVCSTKRYGASSSSEVTYRVSTTSTNWSVEGSAFGSGTDNSISGSAIDEWCGHF